MPRPTVLLAGAERNPFKLLARAHRAMFEAGWSLAAIDQFNLWARQRDVVRASTRQTSGALCDEVIEVVRRNCKLIEE